MTTDVERQILSRNPSNIKPGLGRITALLDLLGSPQQSFRSIHVTGTNGKTSTVRMIESLIRAHELRTGLFTSPHLHTLRERISIDGEQISAETLEGVYNEILPMVQIVDAAAEAENDTPVSYFELTVAIALAAFSDAPVDVAAIEVGLGGVWDATNVVHAPVAAITPISLDHTRLLGSSVAEIAREKAGIIHEGATAILGHQPEEAMREILLRAEKVEATIARAGHEFGLLERHQALGGQQLRLQGLGGEYSEIFLPLYGEHQAQNAAVALASVEAFFGASRATKPLSEEVVQAGFAEVASPGRLERMRTAPAVLLDAAHNPAGLSATLEAVAEAFRFARLTVVFSAFEDKEVDAMLELLEPAADEIVITQNSSLRAENADELAARAVEIFGASRVEVAPRMSDALEAAVRLAEESMDDTPLGGAGVLVTGSVHTVADARELLR